MSWPLRPLPGRVRRRARIEDIHPQKHVTLLERYQDMLVDIDYTKQRSDPFAPGLKVWFDTNNEEVCLRCCFALFLFCCSAVMAVPHFSTVRYSKANKARKISVDKEHVASVYSKGNVCRRLQQYRTHEVALHPFVGRLTVRFVRRFVCFA